MDDLVDPFNSYSVLDIPAVQLFDGDPALPGQPFQDGIGHAQGRSRDPGQIPLPQGLFLSPGIVNILQNKVFGINNLVIHEKMGKRGLSGRESGNIVPAFQGN